VTKDNLPIEQAASAGRKSAVRPYPVQWERHLVLRDGWRVFARPIRPDDEPRLYELLQHVTKEDLRLRFFDSIREFSHVFLARLTQLDYAQAMAFIAFDDVTGETLGVVRIHSDAIYQTGEYAILLKSDLKGRGLGWALMEMMIAYARSEGLKRVFGQILQENSVMLDMCRELGFAVTTDPEDRCLCDVILVLDPPTAGNKP
jgi:acetyltransferase